MQAYAWPGNLREMRNVFERAVLLSGGVARIDVADLRFEAILDDDAGSEVLTLDEMERRHIARVVQLESGNVDRAAVQLGVSRSTLYQKLKRYRDVIG